MGLFGGKKGTTQDSLGVSLPARVDVAEFLGRPGVVTVRLTDGPTSDTRELVEEFRQQGLAEVTALMLDSERVKDSELIALVEMETRELLEEHGYTAAHVRVLYG
ncbi:MAG: hypothetical protein LBN10_00895 [Propionibacteriaceae bacterium]|jgi:translation elongation factor EF-Tu-like GTPase|nr:hypothetical protein [Propionibacteriaceae bacterium]